jgi:hypothetical protein
MQSTQSEKYITLKHNNKDFDLSIDEYSRWLCLLEGIDIVDKKMSQYGSRLKNEDVDWIKPLAFQKYITERFESMKNDIEESENSEEQKEFTIIKHKTTCITSQEPALL